MRFFVFHFFSLVFRLLHRAWLHLGTNSIAFFFSIGAHICRLSIPFLLVLTLVENVVDWRATQCVNVIVSLNQHKFRVFEFGNFSFGRRIKPNWQLGSCFFFLGHLSSDTGARAWVLVRCVMWFVVHNSSKDTVRQLWIAWDACGADNNKYK